VPASPGGSCGNGAALANRDSFFFFCYSLGRVGLQDGEHGGVQNLERRSVPDGPARERPAPLSLNVRGRPLRLVLRP
jgi:hypothetical protein